jgi:transcriptional regulator with XRE-family HTH domain
MGLLQREFGQLCKRDDHDRGLSQREISDLEREKFLGRYRNQKTLECLAIPLWETAEALRKRLPEERLRKPTTALGVFIQERRQKRGASRVEGARALGISFHAFTCLELGYTLGLQFRMVGPLASFLRVEESSLISFLSSRQNTPLPEHVKKLKPKRKSSPRMRKETVAV